MLAARNLVGERLIAPALYVPVNLAVAGLLGVIAWRARLPLSELGLERSTLPRGLRVGLVAAAIIALGLAIGAAVPWTQAFFEDERVADIDDRGALAYHALVRIPIGTALFEELAFRGVLFALIARWRSTAAAVTLSSILFGLWHIRPTLSALDTNDLAADATARAGAIALAVAATAVGGGLFCALRMATASLAAPVIVHAAANSLSLLAAYAVVHGV